MPWFQSGGAPTSAVVARDWSTSTSASVSITSTGTSVRDTRQRGDPRHRLRLRGDGERVELAVLAQDARAGSLERRAIGGRPRLAQHDEVGELASAIPVDEAREPVGRASAAPETSASRRGLTSAAGAASDVAAPPTSARTPTDPSTGNASLRSMLVLP